MHIHCLATFFHSCSISDSSDTLACSSPIYACRIRPRPAAHVDSDLGTVQLVMVLQGGTRKRIVDRNIELLNVSEWHVDDNITITSG